MTQDPTDGRGLTHDPAMVEVVCDFVQAIGGTVVNIKRYPTGSAIISMALERCVETLRKLFDVKESFTVAESEKMILVDGDVLSDKIQSRAYVRTFIESLIARNVRSLTFSKGLDEKQILAFLGVFGDKPDDLKRRGSISELVAAAGVRDITLDEKVFVVLNKGQAIADIAELDRLAQLGDDLDPDQVRDSAMVNYIMSQVPFDKLGLKGEQVEALKAKIDYDKLKNAKKIDFEKIGPILARTFEQAAGSDELPEPPRTIDGVSPMTSRETIADARVQQIVNTFSEMAESIFRFENPTIRAKLLNDFLRIVTNFKGLTLAKMLSRRISDSGDVDLKGEILGQISTKKRSLVIDHLIAKYYRLIDGLAPEDFNFTAEEIDESESTLKKIIQLARASQRTDIADKAQRAVSMVRLLSREGRTPEGLLVLKMKRLFAQESARLLDDDFLDGFGELAKRLVEQKRVDILRKLIERIASNFASDDAEVRGNTVMAFVRMHQELGSLSRPDLLNDGYGHLMKQLRREEDPQLFARILATMVSDSKRLVELGDFAVVTNLLRAFRRLRDETADPARGGIMGQAIDRVGKDAEVIATLVRVFQAQNDAESDQAAALLGQLAPGAVASAVLTLLKDSDDMRVRKKCMALLARMGLPVVPALLARLTPDQPWYFSRNILSLLADIGATGGIAQVVPFLTHQDERVRRAAISMLARAGGGEADAALAATYASQPDPLRSVLIAHFAQARNREAVAPLVAALADLADGSNDDRAIAIVQALGQIGDASAAPAIRALLKRGGGLRGFFQKPNDAIVQAGIVALGRMGDADTPSLLKKFVHHSNPAIARAAQESIRALGAG
ncbi:HEAT repeat domain-containing protein [bacterium]|nr:HEAT repeat domain-containing protein [bacterium]